MEQNLDFLSEVRKTYSNLLIEIGFQYLKCYSHACPEEFLETFMPPRDDILTILKREKARIKKKKHAQRIRGRLKAVLCKCSSLCLFIFYSSFIMILESLRQLNSSISKMSMYPSLEDMKVDQTIRAQLHAFETISQQQQLVSQHQQNHGYPNLTVPGVPSAPPMGLSPLQSPVYPDLVDYMGLELSQDVIAANMPEYLKGHAGQGKQLTSYVPPSLPNNMIAPLSGSSVGLARAGATNGIRELILCKDAKGKVGLRVQSINKGVFVCVVVRDSPAAMAGLRFGDQILQVNGTTVAGYSVDDVHKILKASAHNNISVVIRDRPFERIVTLHKDSTNSVGFQFKNGKITSIVKDSSAARNGLLIEHQLLEINGQNVVRLC